MATRKRPGQSGGATIVPGVHAEAVRDFLLQSAELPNWSPAYLQKILGIGPQESKTVLSALSMVGYIEPDPDSPRSWRNTDAGNAMAKVSRARPVKRETADKSVDQIIDRIRNVNLESQYLYAVDQAVVFGPYLTGSDSVKNVDIAIALAPKIRDAAKLEERVKADADSAEAEGKRFKSYADKRSWGENKVRQYLKSRTRAIALYDINESILGQPHKVIYSRSEG
jgi:hypothetical protein